MSLMYEFVLAAFLSLSISNTPLNHSTDRHLLVQPIVAYASEYNSSKLITFEVNNPASNIINGYQRLNKFVDSRLIKLLNPIDCCIAKHQTINFSEMLDSKIPDGNLDSKSFFIHATNLELTTKSTSSTFTGENPSYQASGTIKNDQKFSLYNAHTMHSNNQKNASNTSFSANVPLSVGIIEWAEDEVETSYTGKITLILFPQDCHIKMPGTKKFVKSEVFTSPIVEVPSGPVPGVETVQVYCVDEDGQRLPLDPGTFYEVTRTVSAPLNAPLVNSEGTDFVEHAVIQISTSDASEVRYTTDNTEVLTTSSLYFYDEPPVITATAVVKARAFKVGFRPSPEASTTINVFPKPVTNLFKWTPQQVAVGQASTLSWDIQNVKECHIVGLVDVKPANGTVGPVIQNIAKVEKSLMSCVDLAGGRFPISPTEFLEAELQVAAGGYLITTNPGQGGTIAPSEITVAAGTSTEFIISANPGYEVSAVSGCGGALNGSTYATGSISAPCTINASFIETVSPQPETPVAPTMAAVPTLAAIGHDPTAGIINGEFQVSASGAATYNIPLLLPAGIAGTTPNIAFTYNSHAGNGPLGVGWQVSGLSGISRCRKTLADDGFFAAIEFNQQDAICLDGQRLVLISGSEWSDQAIYHTKIESMQRVRLLHVGGKIQFAVDRADGSTYFYGQTLDSVQQDQQSSQIYVWHLSAITDASGNTINFNYINADRHQAYLSKIQYSGNTVDFVYDNLRVDKKSGYFQGNKFLADLRLNDVIIKNHRETVTRSYYLQYIHSVNTGASLLHTLQQCNGKKADAGGQCLQTIFSHEESTYNPIAEETYNLFDSVGGQKVNEVKSADINGDGRNDYIVTYGGGDTGIGPNLKVFLFGTSGFYQKNETPISSNGSYVVKDIDGNGTSEIIVRNHHNTIETETIYRWTGQPGNGELVAEVVSDVVKNYGQYGPDIDGNGLPDREEYQQRWLNKNNSWEFIDGFDGFDLLSFLGYEDFDTNGGYTRVTHEIMSDATGGSVDFNSDGIPDIFNITSRSSITIDDPTIPDCAGSNICRLELIYDAVSVGMDGSQVYIKESLGNFGYSGELSDAIKVPNYVFPDINGDGNADVFDMSGSPNTINQGVLKGTGLASDAVAPPPYKIHAWYADVNMDGADDYIFKPEGGSSTGLYYKTFDSINNIWSADILLPNSTTLASKIGSGRQQVSFADIDGDGLYDHSVVDLDEKTIWVQTGSSLNIKLDVVKAIKISNIKEIQILYLGATSGFYPGCSYSVGFYTGGEIPCVYVDNQEVTLPSGDYSSAVLNLKAAQDLVYNVVEYNYNFDQSGYSLTADIEYQYKGYRVQAGGVGSLGFESILIHNKISKTATVSEYYQQYPFVGILKSNKVYFSPNQHRPSIEDPSNLLSEYQADELTDISLNSGKTRFVSVGRSQSTEYTMDFLNGSQSSNHTRVKAVVDERIFTKFSDSYVNLTSETSSTTDETTLSTYNVTTVSEYENENLINWWIGKPTKKVVTHQRTGSYTSGNTVSRSMGYTYYPAHGLLESETIEPEGDASNYLKTHFSYDEFGNKTTVTQCSLSFSEQCDTAALPSTLNEITDIFRRTVSVYDTDGRYLKEVQNSGLTSQYFDSYNMLGQPTSMRQLVNNVSVQTDIFYDDFGKEYFRRSADGSAVSTAIAFGSDGPETAVFQITTLSNVAPATRQYLDASGNVVRTSTRSFDGSWVNIDASYNELNQKDAETVPYFSDETDPATSSFEYDQLHRLIRQTAADATVTSFEYSALTTHKKVTGNYASVLVDWSMSINRSSSTITNAFGNVVKVVDEHGQELSFSYDAVGNADLLTGVDGVQIDPEFDSYGRRTALKDPNKGDWYFSYNGLGELVKTTAPDNIITEEFRDNLGRVRSRTVTKGREVETSQFVYDGQKLTEEYITGGSRQGFGYDMLGRVSSSTTTIDNLTFTTSKTYDQYGRTFQHFDASGNSRGLRYGYNNYGYLEFMREAANGVDGLKYYEILAMDERGNVTSSQAGNGLTTLRNFDQKTGFIKDIQTGLAGQVQSLAYEFDGVGNLRARIDYNNLDITDTTQSLYEEFEYDDLNRLTKVKRNLSGNLLTTQEMSYAHNGNILSKSDVKTGAAYNYNSKPAVCSNDSLVGGHSVQSIGQLSYCYDGRGNQTHSFDNAVQQRTVEYSAFDLPTKITSLTGSTDFTYDVQRKRIKRVDTENAASTTTYYLDSVEYILRPNGGSEYKRYLGNAAIEIVRSNGTKELNYLHQDHLGSLDVISNNQGQKTECLSFDAFGKRRQCSGWNPVTDAFAEISLSTILAITPRGFTGHEHIDHAEVIHMNGRIYDPKNGRFMQADPIVQAPDHSQSPNRYSYVFNNPLSYTDPTGFVTTPVAPLVDLQNAWDGWGPSNSDLAYSRDWHSNAAARHMKKLKNPPAALDKSRPGESQSADSAANKVDQQQTGSTGLSDEYLQGNVQNKGDGDAVPGELTPKQLKEFMGLLDQGKQQIGAFKKALAGKKGEYYESIRRHYGFYDDKQFEETRLFLMNTSKKAMESIEHYKSNPDMLVSISGTDGGYLDDTKQLGISFSVFHNDRVNTVVHEIGHSVGLTHPAGAYQSIGDIRGLSNEAVSDSPIFNDFHKELRRNAYAFEYAVMGVFR